METRLISDSPHFRTKDGIAKLGAADAGVSPRDFADVVTKLLEDDAADFRNAERILDVMRRQGRTISGYPRIRPDDCVRVIDAIRAIFDANQRAFSTGDRAIVERFDQIVDAFTRTDVRFYPRELMLARALHAETRLLLNDPNGARALIGDYADRPYKIEGDRRDLSLLMRLDCKARAAVGQIEGLGRLATTRALWLCRIWPLSAGSIVSDFIDFLSLDRAPRLGDGLLAWLLYRSAQTTARMRIDGGSLLRRVGRKPVSWSGRVVASACLYLLRYGDLRALRKSRRIAGKRDIFVSRAMGGIGDLLVMTPGLRALSKRHSTKVKLVIDRKYFDIFRNNPHVETIDIDGPPIDVSNCRAWYNLTLCPAGRYEAARRPFVKKGRVELFAEGMGVTRAQLNRRGWDVECVLDDDQIKFRDAFVGKAGFGARPIVGVQPYARDSYKDHPDIGRFVEALSLDYDIIIFHHVETGLPQRRGIVSTAGLPLAQSTALVSALDAMVCVDSGFLHAAGAFDVPVVAMFGPTDGRLFTLHHKHATVIAANDSFPCSPCWRNEDIPCQLTGQFGPSPCIAALKVEPVLAAVAAALR